MREFKQHKPNARGTLERAMQGNNLTYFTMSDLQEQIQELRQVQFELCRANEQLQEDNKALRRELKRMAKIQERIQEKLRIW